MPAYATDAFVLRRLQYGETDNILTLFSAERGRFSAIAKGARKAVSRLSGASEVLNLSRFGLASGKSLDIVTQAETIQSFRRLRTDLTRLASGLYFADLVDHSLAEHQPNEALYGLLSQALHLLENDAPPSATARWFESQSLREMGYAPQWSRCSICRSELPGDFDEEEIFALAIKQGSAVCPRHAHPGQWEDHAALGRNALLMLQQMDLLEAPEPKDFIHWGAISAQSELQARTALRRTIRLHLERDLHSIAFLDSVSATGH